MDAQRIIYGPKQICKNAVSYANSNLTQALLGLQLTNDILQKALHECRLHTSRCVNTK